MPKADHELSVFVDESGSFDSSVFPSRFYLVTCVFHDQSLSLATPLGRLDEQLACLSLSGVSVHTGPLIRREGEYREMDIVLRRKIFGRMVAFARSSPISYHSFAVDKKFFSDPVAMQRELLRQLRDYLAGDGRWISDYSRVKVYYDNGQAQVKSILREAFALVAATFSPDVTPGRYRLFQVADLICTLELLRQKLLLEIPLTNSEEYFFGSRRDLKKNVLRPIMRLGR